MSIKYLDFDLLIERGPARYRARVLDSPAGEASIEFAIPFSQPEIDDFFIQIGQTRSFETQQIRKIHQFGQSLFEAVFAGQVRDRLRASLGEASLKSAGLRIRLRLADTPELGNLPWEFIYDPGLNRFLALSVETPVVRYLETTQLAQPLAVQPPLRILAMICGPKDFPRLDVEREWENLQASLETLQERRLVDLQRLSPPTLPALQQRLRREQYHIFHFIGHGIFSTSDQDGFLLFENEQRGGHRLSGRDLGTILHDHRPLRLAVLNSCEGARTALDDQFAGAAQSLVQQGIPAVIAMQFRITDQASITLAHEFYGALADGYPVDAALTEARKAIKTEGNDLEWGTPVLYMRSPDGHIFDIAQLPGRLGSAALMTEHDLESAARVERLYTEGLEAFYLGQWEIAYRKFQATIDSDPDHRDAAAKLETARQKMHNQALNEQALASEKAGDWEKALDALTQLSADDPAFPAISTRIANARRQARLTGLYSEAKQLAQAEKWEAILGIFKEMSRIDPHPPDPDGLRSRAEQTLAKTRRDAELESTYNSALNALDAGEWNLAVRRLRRVRQLQPGYRETTQLLHRAEAELNRIRIEKSRSAIHVITARRIPLAAWLPVLFAVLAAGNAIETGWKLPGVIPAGILYSLALWMFLASVLGKLDTMDILILLGATTLGQFIIVGTGLELAASRWAWLLLNIILGGVIGSSIAVIAHRRNPGLERRRLVLIAAAWLLGYALAYFVFNIISGSDLVFIVVVPAVIAGLGGGITLSQLRAGAIQHRAWNLPAPIRSLTLGWRAGNRFEGILLAFFGISALGKLLGQLAGSLIASLFRFDLPSTISVLFFMIPGGLFSGMGFWWFLRKAAGKPGRKEILTILAAGIIGQTIIVETGLLFRFTLVLQWSLLWAVYGVIIGIPIAFLSLRKLNAFESWRFVLIVTGWGLGYAVAVPIVNVLRGDLARVFGPDTGTVILMIVEQSMAAFLGGWVTLTLLESGGHRRINWKTVAAGAAGFYLATPFFSYLLGWGIFSRWWPIQNLLLGLIAGGPLAVPSRNFRRYILLGLSVATGMILGQFLTRATEASGEFQALIQGALVGLCLGLLTRRLSAVLTCSIVGIFAYLSRAAIWGSFAAFYSQPLLLAATRSLPFAVAGAIIALGWSMLTADENQPAAKQIT